MRRQRAGEVDRGIKFSQIFIDEINPEYENNKSNNP